MSGGRKQRVDREVACGEGGRGEREEAEETHCRNRLYPMWRGGAALARTGDGVKYGAGGERNMVAFLPRGEVTKPCDAGRRLRELVATITPSVDGGVLRVESRARRVNM